MYGWSMSPSVSTCQTRESFSVREAVGYYISFTQTYPVRVRLNVDLTVHDPRRLAN